MEWVEIVCILALNARSLALSVALTIGSSGYNQILDETLTRRGVSWSKSRKACQPKGSEVERELVAPSDPMPT